MILQFQSYATLLSRDHRPMTVSIAKRSAPSLRNAPLKNDPQQPQHHQSPRNTDYPPFRWTDFPSSSSTAAASPKGSFVFRDSTACAAVSQGDHPCLVHFPSQQKQQQQQQQDSHQNDSKNNNQSNNIPVCHSDNACLLTRKGYKPPLQPLGVFGDPDENEVEEQPVSPTIPNQDRSLLIQPLRSSTATGDATTDNNDNDDDFLLLLADGHGSDGHFSSAAVQRDLPIRILKLLEEEQPTTTDAVKALLEHAFLECDKVIQKVVTTSGTTTIVVLQYQSMLAVASVGDSTATIWGYNSANTATEKPALLFEAIKHKPHLPAERQRIEQHQGRVIMPQGPGDSSRVVIPYTDGGFMGEMALAMSRSMGDTDGKIPGWLSAEPSVQVWDLDKTRSFAQGFDKLLVMVCSDGVSDMQPINSMAGQLRQSLFTTNSPNSVFESTMQRIMTKSADEWFQKTFNTYRDDMTLVVTSVSAPKNHNKKTSSIFANRLRGM